MELVKENTDKLYLNIDSFSSAIGKSWNVPQYVLKHYILSNVSMAMIRNSEIKKALDKLYSQDKNKYYTAVKNSPCREYIIMTDGTLEQEIQGRKALGILLIAEDDFNLRNTIIKLLKNQYPIIFNAVKKHDKKDLSKRYVQMDEITRETEARLDSSVYFYFAIYRFPETIDQGFIKSIINDMKYFEFYNPLTRDINKELDLNKLEIQQIKILIKKEFGKINSYKDILNSNLQQVKELSSILENIFIINKLDITYLFSNSNFINIDEIILAYLKRENKSSDPQIILQAMVNGIFLKSFINEYKKSRELYFHNNEEELLNKISLLEENLIKKEEENKNISDKVATLQKQNSELQESLYNEINKLNKKHNYKICEMQNKVNTLEKQLLEENNYRGELNILRDYIFKVTTNYTPENSEKTLEEYILNKNIIIIGGAKEWRRKFRDRYPNIRSLNGFNETFDTNILANYDYVFFYTGFMNHATYHKAMSYIRTHEIKFGYLGKTNIELLEEEFIDELKRLN